MSSSRSHPPVSQYAGNRVNFFELKPVTPEERALKPVFEEIEWPHPDDAAASDDPLWEQRKSGGDDKERRARLSTPENMAMLQMVRDEVATALVDTGLCEDTQGAFDGVAIAQSGIEAAWLPPHVRVVTQH